MPDSRSVVTCLIVMGLLAPVRASAQALVAGWEGNASKGYVFAMPMFEIPEGNAAAVVLRGGVNYLYYDVPTDATTLRVSSPGAWLGAGLRLRGKRVAATVGPGFEVRRTVRKTSGRLIEREIERGLTAQGDMFAQISPRTVLSFLGSYGVANRYVWVRSGLRQQLSAYSPTRSVSWALLGDATFHGNQDQRVMQAGGGVEFGVRALASSIQFRSGTSRESTAATVRWRPYFGVGLYREF